MTSVACALKSAARAGLLAAAVITLTSCAGLSQVFKVLVGGESRTLRDRPPNESSAPSRPALLILAIDGMGRDLLYSMLAEGDLPELAALLGKDGAGLPSCVLRAGCLDHLPLHDRRRVGDDLHRRRAIGSRVHRKRVLRARDEAVRRADSRQRQCGRRRDIGLHRRVREQVAVRAHDLRDDAKARAGHSHLGLDEPVLSRSRSAAHDPHQRPRRGARRRFSKGTRRRTFRATCGRTSTRRTSKSFSIGSARSRPRTC